RFTWRPGPARGNEARSRTACRGSCPAAASAITSMTGVQWAAMTGPTGSTRCARISASEGMRRGLSQAVAPWIQGVTLREGQLVKIIGILLAMAFAISGCAHNPAVSTSSVRITLNVIADGSFSFVYQGQTISLPGAYTFNVPAGVQEVSG